MGGYEAGELMEKEAAARPHTAPGRRVTDPPLFRRAMGSHCMAFDKEETLSDLCL